MNDLPAGAIARHVFGFAASTLAFIAWKVFDTPFQRQLERQVAPYLVEQIAAVIDVVLLLAVALAPVLFLWRVFRRG